MSTGFRGVVLGHLRGCVAPARVSTSLGFGFAPATVCCVALSFCGPGVVSSVGLASVVLSFSS
eukprot:9300463-Prorocentrum_lima.AAC.1